jgi:ribosomal protein S27E
MPKKYNLKEIEEMGNIIHNNKYEYLGFINIKGKKHIHLKCKNCNNEFNQVIYSHIKLKCDCPKCKRNKKYSLDEIKEIGKKIHNDKYEYIDIINIKNKRYLKIKCKECSHIFKQLIDNHLNKKCECPKCKKRLRYNLEEIKDIGNKIHNNKYKYLELKKRGKYSIIKLKCKKCGNIFEQYVDNHLNKKFGCKFCKPVSKGVIIIEEYLKNNNILFEKEKSFEDCKLYRKLYFDFYLPEYNLLIEYNGEQHYKPNNLYGGNIALEKQKIRDNIKVEYCLRKNLKLITINYKSNKNIHDILDIETKKVL